MIERMPRRVAGTPGKPVRTFFALWPDDRARERLAAIAADVARAGGGRSVAPANLHVTVAFVGDVAQDRIALLCDAGEAACANALPFDVALERLGGAHDDELVWIAPASLPVELVELHGRLAAALGERAFAVEQRAFRPHVTLARRCTRRVARVAIVAIAWRVERLSLMASTTRPEGAQYRELGSWPIAAT